jgi:hypothetical protein
MHHPQLGQLETKGESLHGNTVLVDRIIPIHIELDGVALDEALSLTVTIASSLSVYDQISKDVIIRDLLEMYNSGWNEYEEVQDDGSFKSVVNPQLNAQDFINRVKLVSVSITGDSCVELWYNDDGLFWGHSILVQSLEGPKTESFEAQIVG